jgi:hypothetical protein
MSHPVDIVWHKKEDEELEIRTRVRSRFKKYLTRKKERKFRCARERKE